MEENVGKRWSCLTRVVVCVEIVSRSFIPLYGILKALRDVELDMGFW